MTDSVQPADTPQPPSRWKRSIRFFLRMVLWMVFWIGVVLGSPLYFLNEFVSRTSPDTGLYIGLIVSLIVPLAVGAKVSFRLTGFDWDWTFAGLVALHTLIMEMLLITDSWHPTISGMKGVLVAFVFALLLMMLSAVIRIYKKKPWRALALFQLVTLVNIFYLYLFLELGWFS